MICDWILGNHSNIHIGNYKKIDFKDLRPLQPAKDCEHVDETYTKDGSFTILESFTYTQLFRQIRWKISISWMSEVVSRVLTVGGW